MIQQIYLNSIVLHIQTIFIININVFVFNNIFINNIVCL